MHREQLRRASAVLLSIVVVFGLAVASPVTALPMQTAPATQEEVFKAIGVDDVPVDYVLIIDTSASMQQLGLWPNVAPALRTFLNALKPNDHLSLILFDTTPDTKYSGDVGTPQDRAADRLPTVAAGQQTDIGSAIETGLNELTRPDANRLQTVVLITDGAHDPGRGSAYPTKDAPAWDAQTGRAAELAKNHRTSAYALALTDQADAALLKSVFPSAQKLSLPGDQISPFLDRVKQETRLAQARSLLEPDLTHGVDVSWDSLPTTANLNEASTATTNLVLHSGFAMVPVTVTSLAVTTAGDIGVSVQGVPASVELKPGETKTIPVTVSYPTIGGRGWGEKTETRDGTLNVSGTLTTSWQKVMTEDLGLSFEPKLKSAEAKLSGSGITGTSWTLLVMMVLFPLLLVALVWWYRLSRQPRLKDFVVATLPGQPAVKSSPLTGRKAVIGSGKGSKLKVPGKGDVRGVRLARSGKRKGFDLGLSIRYSSNGKAPKSGTVKPNHSVSLDGVTFTYQSSRK